MSQGQIVVISTRCTAEESFTMSQYEQSFDRYIDEREDRRMARAGGIPAGIL